MSETRHCEVSADAEFKWVTSQIATERQRAEAAFRLYLQMFSALVGGSIWLSIQPSIAHSAHRKLAVLTDIAVTLAMAAVSVMLLGSWRAWFSYRRAQSVLMPHVPPPRRWPSGVVWGAMFLCILVATGLFWMFNPFTI